MKIFFSYCLNISLTRVARGVIKRNVGHIYIYMTAKSSCTHLYPGYKINRLVYILYHYMFVESSIVMIWWWFCQAVGMTGRTNAVAKTRAYQVRWSSWCRSRTTRGRPAAGARGATAGGKGRSTELRLSSSASTSQLQPDNHALLWPQKSKLNNFYWFYFTSYPYK